jgi:hypothetical protein
MAVLGVIHHNKSGSSDPLNLVMASKAFTAVARSVHSVIRDPDDETESRRLFGTPKNNLGRLDLPTLTFTIHGYRYPTTDGEEGWTGRLEWGEDADGSIGDAIRRSVDQTEDRSIATEAADWLQDWLTAMGGTDHSANVQKAAKAAGQADRAIRAARSRLRIKITSHGFQRESWWSLPDTQLANGDTTSKVVTRSRDVPPGEMSPLTQPSQLGGQHGQHAEFYEGVRAVWPTAGTSFQGDPPWPTSPAARLKWLATCGHRIWLPTGAQRADRWLEVHGDVAQQRRAQR